MGDVVAFRRLTSVAVPAEAIFSPQPEPEPQPRPRARQDPAEVRARGAAEPLWRQLAGHELRTERQRRQETLAQVATRAGISVQYLSEIERGRKEPSSEVLAAVAGALQLTLLDLTGAVTRRLELPRRLATGPVRGSGPVALAA